MLNLPIDRVDYVVVDVETTGLDPKEGHRVCEIGAVRIRSGEEIGRFHALVNPQRSIPAAASRVNGITGEMLEGALPASVVLPGFLAFAADAALAAYNARFDLSFLRMELQWAGLPSPDAPVIDVLWMARQKAPGLDRYALGHVARALGIAHHGAHRALGDVEVTAQLLLRFIPQMKESGVLTISDMVLRQRCAGILL